MDKHTLARPLNHICLIDVASELVLQFDASADPVTRRSFYIRFREVKVDHPLRPLIRRRRPNNAGVVDDHVPLKQ